MMRTVTRERDIALGGRLAHHLHAVGDDIGDVDRAEIEGKAPGLDLGHVENVVDHLQQIGAARINVAGIFLIFGVAERAEQPLLHHLGKADHGVERRAQLVADIGEELGLRPVGGFGAILLERIFLREIDELLLLLLELTAGEPELRHARSQLLLAFRQALLALLQHGDVGADADIAAVLGAALVDMQPAAVIELRLVSAAIAVIGAGNGNPPRHDRLRRRGDDLLIRAAGVNHIVGQAVELLVLAVAHHELVLAVPQHESFGDRLDRIAQPRIGVGRGVRHPMIGDYGDAGQARLAAVRASRDMTAQPESDPMPLGVAEAEALVEGANSFTEVPVELASQIVVGMQRLGDHAERHGPVEGLEPEQPIHGRRPVDMAACEVQAPDAAAGQCLGQLFGEASGACGGRRRGEIPEAAGEQGQQQSRADEESDLEPRVAPPVEERLVNGLKKGQLRVAFGDVADGDDGVGAVGEGQAQHAGLGAESGERLLRAKNGE